MDIRTLYCLKTGFPSRNPKLESVWGQHRDLPIALWRYFFIFLSVDPKKEKGLYFDCNIQSINSPTARVVFTSIHPKRKEAKCALYNIRYSANTQVTTSAFRKRRTRENEWLCDRMRVTKSAPQFAHPATASYKFWYM